MLVNMSWTNILKKSYTLSSEVVRTLDWNDYWMEVINCSHYINDWKHFGFTCRHSVLLKTVQMYKLPRELMFNISKYNMKVRIRKTFLF